VASSADGTMAASGGADGQIRIWKVPTGECLRILRGGEGETTSLALFRDGSTLVAGASSGKLRIWNLGTGELTRTLDAHSAAINCIALSGDEKLVATGSSDKTIALWNTGDWSRARALPETSGPVYALCFAPSLEATSAKTASNGPAQKIGPGYFKEVFTNESLHDAASRVQIVAQDAWLISGGRDGQSDADNSALCVWGVNDGQLLRRLQGHKGAVTSIRFDRDLNLLVSGSCDKSIRLWNPADISNLADDQSVRAVSGYTSAVTAIACPPQGTYLWNADDKGELHLWDIDQGISLRKGGLKGSFFNILAILLAFPTGMLVDRFHPLRVTMVATLLIAPTQIAYYFFAHDYLSMVWLDCLKIPLYCVLSAAAMPLSMQLFPKSKYGQFCAAASTIRSAVVAAGGVVGALAMDWMTDTNRLTDNFRYGFLWLGVSYFLIFAAWLLVHREWKKLGGEKYLAPES
jgi:hypothetical protein